MLPQSKRGRRSHSELISPSVRSAAILSRNAMSASVKSRKSVRPLQAEAARERLRRRYRPARVRILFVGEAPPASGRFFYQETPDSTALSGKLFCRPFRNSRVRSFWSHFANWTVIWSICAEVRSTGLPTTQRRLACTRAEARTGQDDSAAESSTRCYGCSLHHSQRPTRTVSGKVERHSS